MQTKIGFLTGMAVGYVFGARAGRTRYEQIKKQADTLWSDPRVQDKVSAATETVKAKAPEVKDKVTSVVAEKAPVIGQRLAGAASGAASTVSDKATGVAAAAKDKASDVTSAATDKASDLASTAQDTATDLHSPRHAAPSHEAHTGNQIGVEPTSDVEPHTVKFESAEDN